MSCILASMCATAGTPTRISLYSISMAATAAPPEP